jgi:hypothetical protein
MSAAGRGRSDRPDDGVRRPAGPDLLRILVLEMLVGGAFALLALALLGSGFLGENWFAWPAAFGVVTPVEFALGFPTVTARVVIARPEAIELQRGRRRERFDWGSFRLRPGTHWHPLYGRGPVEQLSRMDDRVSATVWLTSAQHAYLVRHAPPGTAP